MCASHLLIITTQPVCRPYLRDLHLSPCGEDVAVIVPVQHEALDGAIEGGRRSVDLDLNKTTVMDHVSNNRHQHETSNKQLQNSNMSEAFGPPKILHHVKSRAANPSLDLSVLKSDFKRRNLILSVMHMVLCKSISGKNAPAQQSSMIVCRESDVHYKICAMHLRSNYIQMP